jgi:hypothetical protein
MRVQFREVSLYYKNVHMKSLMFLLAIKSAPNFLTSRNSKFHNSVTTLQRNRAILYNMKQNTTNNNKIIFQISYKDTAHNHIHW